MNSLGKGTPGLCGFLKLVLDGEPLKELALGSSQSKPEPSVEKLFLLRTSQEVLLLQLHHCAVK